MGGHSPPHPQLFHSFSPAAAFNWQQRQAVAIEPVVAPLAPAEVERVPLAAPPGSAPSWREERAHVGRGLAERGRGCRRASHYLVEVVGGALAAFSRQISSSRSGLLQFTTQLKRRGCQRGNLYSHHQPCSAMQLHSNVIDHKAVMYIPKSCFKLLLGGVVRALQFVHRLSCPAYLHVKRFFSSWSLPQLLGGLAHIDHCQICS